MRVFAGRFEWTPGLGQRCLCRASASLFVQRELTPAWAGGWEAAGDFLLHHVAARYYLAR
jgi:hypothetical protein